MITGDFKSKGIDSNDILEMRRKGETELDFELDLEHNLVEQLSLPLIAQGKYIHDFKVHNSAKCKLITCKLFLKR